MQAISYHMHLTQFFYGYRCVQNIVKFVCITLNLLTISNVCSLHDALVHSAV